MTLGKNEVEALIKSNAPRDKTKEDKAREAKTLKEVEDSRAEKRRKATQNNNAGKGIADTANPPYLDEEGESRNIVANYI